MRKSNLTYEELIELAPKDRPFQIEYTTYDNKKDILWSIVDTFEDGNIELFTDFIGTQPGKYEFTDNEYINWKDSDITFTLIDEYRNMYEKPEVLEVGTKVEILESVSHCGDYRQSYKMNIGRIGQICFIHDNDFGVNYDIDFGTEDKLVFVYPHYCVRPVEKVEEKDIPEFEDTISQLENLVTQAQDIISKYKK